MLSDRRKVNRLLKRDRRRSADRRIDNHYTGTTGLRSKKDSKAIEDERRELERRFVDRSN